MEETSFCHGCRQPVRMIDNFCPNCGKKLHSLPLSASLSSLIILLLKTLLLPPFGFYWGYRYLRQPDHLSKYVGFFTILITFVELIWLVQTTVSTLNLVKQQLNQQLQLNGL